MRIYKMSEEEKAYLENYNIEDFERPSVAADMAVFAIMKEGGGEAGGRLENYRKDPEQKLKLLLIKRGSYPYKNEWALPGGFCRKGESTLETARRELCEETGIKDAYLRPFDIFSEPGRDPRGWIISHAFLTLVNGENYRVHAGSDAWEAGWFSISIEKKELCREIEEEKAHIRNCYYLKLICEGKPDPGLEKKGLEADKKRTELRAEIIEDRYFQNYHETIDYEIVRSEGIGFDHAKVILCAFLALQKEVNENGKPVFDLMPERFTLTALQKAFEIVQGKKLLVANFRRKIADYVIETDEMAEGAGHRPAKLFRRNLERFYE